LPEEFPQINLSIEKYKNIYAPFYPNFSNDQFESYLKEFEIDDKNAIMSKLSHGQKKKIMIAFGLATNTKLLLMDEPTNGLDIPSKGQFRRMVASAITEERCLVISTHQVHDLDSLIDNIIVMEKHEIVFNQAIENITRKLVFRLTERNEICENVIHTEESLRGMYQVCENTTNEESKLDIELLFNTILLHTAKVKSLF
jgi:ABC-2 type transport system ATP-binding protein